MLNVPNLQLNSDETVCEIRDLIHLLPANTAANRLATHVGIVDKLPQSHKAHRQLKYFYSVILLIN